ncbi:MAG: IclR family transcriptional regulator C-terminal domain-containing protein, partial [Anaerolineae bacterium]
MVLIWAESLLLGEQITNVPDRVKAANPETYITPATPPFLVQHGTKDTVIPLQCSINLAARLARVAGSGGVQLVELGLSALRGLDFRRTAFPYMQQLVERFREVCTLAIFDRGQMLYVEVVYSERSLTIAARVGRHLPAHCTASGKVLLASLPPDTIEPMLAAPLASYTEKTITSPDRLREELEQVRRRGYAVADEEFEVGI